MIIAALFALIVRMFLLVHKQKNICGFLVSLAACIAIAGQFVMYVLTNLGVIGSFSSSLPLISFGGMGFVVNMALIGLVLSVYRRTDLVKDRIRKVAPDGRLFTFKDGKLIIDFGSRRG